MMGRIILSRLRRIAPDPGWLIAFGVMFVFIEGLLRYLEARRIPIISRMPVRPGNVILLAASVQYGLRRAVEFHPIWSEGYRTWLASTPWCSRKPLPMGPIELVWEDGLVVGSIILLERHLPVPSSMTLVCGFLLGHLLGLTMTLWMTRVRVIGYFTCFTLGLAFWLLTRPVACLAVSTVVYLIAYEGLRRGLEKFPWKPREMPDLSDLNNIRLGAAVRLAFRSHDSRCAPRGNFTDRRSRLLRVGNLVALCSLVVHSSSGDQIEGLDRNILHMVGCATH